MRPDPPDPSTHLNANNLPVTKRRAASAFMFCARAGPVARKLPTKAANRAIIPIPLQMPSPRLRNQPFRQSPLQLAHRFIRGLQASRSWQIDDETVEI